ncbi:hypothetical protein [Kocuria sp. HSID16901]|uniref:hypothetical protein n=1 Tax=Kocuria sp. HSID16901 TaxID=2419505 RepID=UPI0006613F83|nr:hypothetical protein [Kocuria sp. HSID16901]MCT1368087.1 hypothetical protein [Rothia sp. p3-SID1597]RUQ23159.1 hypothetical protein D8M21_00010 [Kocuria sp. HSID16901]
MALVGLMSILMVTSLVALGGVVALLIYAAIGVTASEARRGRPAETGVPEAASRRRSEREAFFS